MSGWVTLTVAGILSVLCFGFCAVVVVTSSTRQVDHGVQAVFTLVLVRCMGGAPRGYVHLPELQAVLIDATINSAHQHAASAPKKGRPSPWATTGRVEYPDTCGR